MGGAISDDMKHHIGISIVWFSRVLNSNLALFLSLDENCFCFSQIPLEGGGKKSKKPLGHHPNRIFSREKYLKKIKFGSKRSIKFLVNFSCEQL